MGDWIIDVRRLIGQSGCQETPDHVLANMIMGSLKDIDDNEIVSQLEKQTREASFAMLSRIQNNSYSFEVYFTSLIKSIKLPAIDWIWYSEVQAEYPEGQLSFASNALYKLNTLEYLVRKNRNEIVSKLGYGEIYNSVLNLSFYCLSGSPWSGDGSSKKANATIELLREEMSPADFLQLITDLLTVYIREQLDILAKTKSILDQKVTKLGYKKLGTDISERFKGINPLLGNQASARMNLQDHWRINNIGSISVFYFIMKFLETAKRDPKYSQESLLAILVPNWGIIISFLLNTLENSEGMIKLKGSQTLECILNIIDSNSEVSSNSRDYFKLHKGEKNILIKTDIGGLLESNIIPCLLSLPSYTPVGKSVLMLKDTYPILLHLYQLTSLNFRSYCEKVTELIDKYLVSSFVKVKDFPELISLLFYFVRSKIIPGLDTYFMVVANKLVYPVLDILIDPFVIYSPNIVVDGLELLLDMIRQLKKTNTQNKYKYDIIAATALIQKRLFRYEVTTRENEINDLTTNILVHLGSELDELENERLNALLAGE